MFATGRRAAGLFCFATACVFLLPVFSHAAELQFSPTTGTVAIDDEILISVKVVPGGADVNAADGTVSFDSTLLSVASISKDGSAFSLWTAEPSFSNSAGTVTFSGGTPSAFKNTATVVTIKFKGKKVGSAKVSFSKGSVLAADGKGTDVYKTGGEATIEVKEAAPAAVAEEPAGEEGGDVSVVPIEPKIVSKIHAKPEQWYATSTADFSWKNPIDVTGVRILFSDKEDAVPSINLKVTDVTHIETDIADGTWFFFVQIKNEFGWGAIGKKKILVDTTPPLEFDFKLNEDGEVPRLVFAAEDKTSGVDRYEIISGSSTLATLRVSDLTEGGAPLPAQAGGITMLAMRAYDKAGNFTEVKKELDLPKVEKANKKEEAPPSIWTWERILLILLAVSTAALGTSLYYTKKKAQEEHSKILRDVIEVRDKNDKVFAAMREEFEQMVQDFDEKPQLTPAERNFLEQIKEVLDISEELTDTGIENLKKTVKGQ